MKGLAPSAATRADLSGSSRGSPADALGDLRVTVRASPPGTPPRTSYSSRSEHPVRFPGDFAGLSHGAPSISFGAPSVDRMSIAASGDGFTSSEDEGAVGLPPSGVVTTAAPDPELTAMLARAAVSIGLEVNRPPSPEPSRLDDWFLGAGRGSQPRPAPVPFFPEVHEELTSSWMAPFTARSRSSASSVLTTLDGGVARGYAGIPQVERAVAVHLCPRNAATWRNRPRLPSKACKLTAALAAKAYSAAGQAAPLLPPVEGREENLLFRFVSVPPLVQGPAVPTFSKKEQISFPPGSQVHGTTVYDALPPHSRPRPILPVAKRVRFGDDIPPHAPLASPVRDPGSSVRMPQNAPPSVPSTPTPFRCTSTGTSIVPLEPLAQRLEAWLTLPSLSRWLTRTIRLGYAIQFARRPPKFNGVLETSVAVRNAPVLREEIAVLLAKDAIEPVPPAEMRQGFYSPYFIVPKKGGGLRPILDLRVLNRALHKLPFKMLTHRRMIKCIQPQDWFAAIDLKDAYFHVSILPRHRPFLRFAFEGRAWQYRVLPFGLSLSPRVFTKVVEGALTPLREVDVRILNYLDDWLILAQSREQLGDHRDLVLRHLSQLGLRVNWEKSKLSPVQRISFLGVELDSVSMTARLTEERAQAVLNCLSSFRGRNVVPLKQFQRLLGHMASAAAVTPLGLLHMRPLQHWLHSRVPRWAWRRGTLRVGISQQCRRSLSPWTDLAFLRAGVPLEQVSRHTVVTTDASSTGWGATCNGQAASGLWTGPRLLWHINCLELWAVHLALRQFRPLLLGKHVLVRTDNTAAVSYINRLGGIRSHRMSQLARHLLLWSHTQFKSLRAVHIPGQLNRAADALSRQLTFPGEWRLHPETIRLIWSRFGEAQVDLFASPESSHCQLYFSLTEGPLGTDALAHSWPRALRKYAFPPVSLLAQTLCKLREDEEQVLLVAPHWPTRTWFPELISLATVPPWRIPLRKDLLSQGLGTIWHPRPDLWNLHVWLLDGTRQTWVVYHRRW